MGDVTVRTTGLSKRYRMHEGFASYDLLDDAGLVSRRRRRAKRPYLWALKDVDIELSRGEAVGIIGANGAGKTTLLKILSRITAPTEGTAELYGRVGSLLEVGTGFHPELTGRENVYLNGAILGMRRKEIERNYDAIVAFADIERFLDVPVKRYSSGMYIRLAFAVAAHFQPEILIVDEVLAVGDAAFQRRCLGKMGDVAREGRTVIVVSHNTAAIRGLCPRSILLQDGRVKADGLTEAVLERYISESLDVGLASTPLGERTDRLGDGRVKLLRTHWEDGAGNDVSFLRTGESYRLVLDFESEGLADVDTLVTFFLKDFHGTAYLLHQSDFTGSKFTALPKAGRFVCEIPRFPLVAGEYLMNVYVGVDGEPADSIPDAARVTVVEGDFFGTGHQGRGAYCRVLVDGRWLLESA